MDSSPPLSSWQFSPPIQSFIFFFLVDGGLVQVVDQPRAIKQAAVAGPGAAEVLAALDDVVGAGQLAVGYAAESGAACLCLC